VGDKTSGLSTLLSPVTEDTFLSSYFQRRPLVVKGRPDKFSHLFVPADFKLGLERVTEIRAVFPGLWQAEIKPADIAEMVRAGATICVTGIERAHAKLSEIAEAIRRETRYAGRVSFRAYLSPPGGGFDLHFDARVATTLQISGRKRWWYSTEPAEWFPAKNSPRTAAEQKARFSVPALRSMRSVTLGPGDLLCLPAGTWHRARAQSMSLALNLAFDHTGATVFDVLSNALSAELSKDESWRAPLPFTPGTVEDGCPPEVLALLRARAGEMQRALDALRKSDDDLKRAWNASVVADDAP